MSFAFETNAKDRYREPDQAPDGLPMVRAALQAGGAGSRAGVPANPV